MTAPTVALKSVLTLHWRPSKDLLAVAISWVLVTASLYTATFVVGSTTGGGFLYFLVYAGLTAALFGVGIPLEITFLSFIGVMYAVAFKLTGSIFISGRSSSRPASWSPLPKTGCRCR